MSCPAWEFDVWTPNKTKKTQTVVVYREKKQTKKQSKKKSSKKRRGMPAGADPIVDIINRPCDAPLVPVYGSRLGYLARITTPYNLQTLSGDNANSGGGAVGRNGYIVWFPQYHCTPSTTAANNAVNCYIFTQNTSEQPVLAGSLFGGAPTANALSGFSNNALNFCADPANQFMVSGTAEDARALSACIRVKYTGTTSSCQGLIYPLSNIPLDAVFNGGGPGVGTLPTVTEMLQYSGDGIRLTDTVDIKFVPDQSAMQFQDVAYGPLLTPGLVTGVPTGDTTMARASQPMGFGFAFQNLSLLANYQVLLTKNFEWRAKPSSGLTSTMARNNMSTPEHVNKAISWLDTHMPGWKTAGMEVGKMGVNILKDIVLAGRGMNSRATNRLRLQGGEL